MQTDVSRPDECCRLADETAALYGGIDILVNSAGNWTLQPIEEVTEESWDRQFDCNLKGAFFCAQAVVPHMLRRGWEDRQHLVSRRLHRLPGRGGLLRQQRRLGDPDEGARC